MGSIARTMAVLATGGVAGMATQADAAAMFQTYGYGATTDHDVTIGANATSQFFYGSLGKAGPKTTSYGLSANTGSGIGVVTPTPGLPAPGEVYPSTQLQTAAQAVKKKSFTSFVPAGGEYVHLSFDINNVAYVGSAFIDEDATLQRIDYIAKSELGTSSIPEPDAWAMLIGGFGMTGAALRRGRRRTQAAANA